MPDDAIHTLICMTETADDDCLAMSRMHCHAEHVSSIVLQNSNGRLLRAFLAWPGHRLHTNTLRDELAVGVHDHRYSLLLSRIHGDVVNVNYERCEDSSQNLLEWEFSTGVATGTPSKRLVGDGRALRETSRETIPDGVWMSLHKDTLHDIEAAGICGWFVQELQTEKDSTTLLTKGQFSTEGMYQPFASSVAVIDHVFHWAKEAGYLT